MTPYYSHYNGFTPLLSISINSGVDNAFFGWIKCVIKWFYIPCLMKMGKVKYLY